MRIFLLALFFGLFITSCRNSDQEQVDDVFMRNEKYDFQGLQIIAHRGVWNYFGGVGNSMGAFTRFMNSDVHGMEMDIRMSKDSVLYVYHDAEINKHSIENTPSEILSQQNISSSEKLPKLEEMLSSFGDNKTRTLFFDVKESMNPKYNKAVIIKLLQLLDQYQLSSSNKIMASERTMQKTLKDYNHKYSSVLLTSSPNFTVESLLADNFREVAVSIALYDSQPELMQQLKNNNIKIHIWTVNDLNRIKTMQGQNIASVITDYPLEIMEHYK